MSRKRNPVGSLRRWREGKLRRLDNLVLDAQERAFSLGIASKLSMRLREKDIAAVELAAALGVSAPAVMHWAAGREQPSLRRLLSISLALGCPLTDLLPDEVYL